MQNNRVVTLLCITIAISIAIGTVAYSFSANKQWTMVLEGKTFESGTGHITLHYQNSIDSVSHDFPFENTEGVSQLLITELPAINLTSLKIAPLLRKGNYEISRLTLSNGTTSYSWKEPGICTETMVIDGKLRREPCGGQLDLAPNEDGSITITSLPEAGMKRAFGARTGLAVAAILASLLCAVWMLRRPNEAEKEMQTHLYGVRAAWLAFIILYAYQFNLICLYSVDVPYHDDWLYFIPEGLTDNFPAKWITSHFLEHRIVPTKLMAWLNLKLFGLDYRIQKIVNYLIFGGMLGTVVVLKNQIIGKKEFPYFPLFLMFLLSPISWENHRWGFQSQIHFVLIFTNLALCHLYREDRHRRSILFFCLFTNLAMYSFAAGVILAGICLCFYLVHTGAGIFSRRIAADRGWQMILTSSAIVVVSVLVWFHGYRKPDHPVWSQSSYVLPTDLDFWGYFLNQLSYFFGIDNYRAIPGIICLVLIITPAVLLLTKRKTRWLPSTWTIITAIAFILAVLVSISMSRTYINATGPKTSRYVEIGALLIPYSALAWWLVFQQATPWRNTLLAALWTACFICYLGHWSPQEYRRAKQVDIFHLECVENYYNGTGNGICQEVTTPAMLDRARNLGVKFTRQFKWIDPVKQ